MLRRLAAAGVVAAFIALLLPMWDPVYRFSGLLMLDGRIRETSLPVLRDGPMLRGNGGYDGQFYVQIACDPSLRDPRLERAVDSLPYRARRILMPAVAWCAGLGDPERIVGVFPWLNIVGWFALAWVLWGVLQAGDRWLGLAGWAGVLLSAGTLASVRCALADLPSLLLLALAVRWAERGRGGVAAGWFGAALLTRETILAGAWGLLSRAWPTDRDWFRSVGWVVVAAVPLALWMAYVSAMAGAVGGVTRNFDWPGLGLWRDWFEEVAFLQRTGDIRLGVPSVLATFSLTVQAVFILRIWRPEDRWWRTGMGSLLLMLVLGPAVWEGIFGAALRVVLPLLLACNVLAVRRGGRSMAVWLLLMNLSVPAGFVEMTPADLQSSLFRSRAASTVILLEEAGGFYGAERNGSDVWAWSAQTAEARAHLWSDQGAVTVVLRAKARSLDGREVIVSSGDRELWRGQVGVDWTDIETPAFVVPVGESGLRFHSPEAAEREGPNADARLFSVCVLNPRLELVDAVEGGRRPTE